jgi:RNA polymerase primary sigma factor
MTSYHHELIAQLARHCTYTPRKRRLQQLARIQKFAASLEDGKSYPYDYTLYQITRFHPDDGPHAVFDAESLRADLIALALDLSDSLDLPVAWAGEPVLTLEEVRGTYDVSLKTVRRWRAQGLLALRLVLPNDRKRTCVRQSDLEAFVESHPRTIRRTGAYSHINAETRRKLIARAFELSLNDEVSLGEAVGRLAREFVCPHAPLRELLERYDKEHPEAPIFTQAAAPLTDDERRQLLALHRTGLPPGEVARHFLLGRSTVGRVVRELITEEVMGHEWRYVPCTAFDEPDAEQAILAEPAPESGVAGRLPVEEELGLFRQYNFLKYQLAKARDELSPSELGQEELERLARIHDRTMAVRNRLVLANLRLVVHLASRHVCPAGSLDQLVSDGTVSLMQAIERFDYNRGVRFSTYASWAILKNFAKTVPREAEARRATTAKSQEIVERAADERPAAAAQGKLRKLLRSLVASMLLELSPREREVVVARFGLGDSEAETLEQIGRRYDITRERVRQIEARALRKLAAVADPELIEELASPPTPLPR